MTFPVSAEILLAYVLQSSLLALLGVSLPRLFRARDPAARERCLEWTLFLALAAPLLAGWLTPAPAASPVGGVVFSAQAAAGAIPAAARPALGWILLAVAAMLLLRRAAGLARLRRYRLAAERVPLERLLGAQGPAFERELGVEAQFYLSDKVGSPLTDGVRRHVVILPRTLSGRPGGVPASIVVHELVHVRRRDWLRLLALETCRAVLWFHPAIRIVISRLIEVREQAVDRETVSLTGGRRAYIEELLAAASVQRPAEGLVTPLFPGRCSLKTRIAVLLEEHTMPRSKRFALALLTIGTLAAASHWAGGALPLNAQQREVHRVADGVVPPRLIFKVEPTYTEEASEQKIQGTVVLAVVVEADGRAHDIVVKQSLDEGLDQKAIEAVEQWRFEPGMKEGEPVAVAATIEINFRVANGQIRAQ